MMESPWAKAFDFSGKVAVVTGSSIGLGRAIALRFAAAGANVGVHYFSHDEAAREVVDEIRSLGRNASAFRADLTQAEEARNLVEWAIRVFGHIDIWVNNAGIYPVSPFLETDLAEWQRVVTANLESAFVCTQAVAQHMIKRGMGGVILNIASIEGLQPAFGHSHYSSAKAGLIMLTRSAAYELGHYGIRVNAVSPGLIARPGLEEAWPEGVRSWLATAPLGRMGEPEEVADACLFLASPLARWITGANLIVDGGAACRPIF